MPDAAIRGLTHRDRYTDFLRLIHTYTCRHRHMQSLTHSIPETDTCRDKHTNTGRCTDIAGTDTHKYTGMPQQT